MAALVDLPKPPGASCIGFCKEFVAPRRPQDTPGGAPITTRCILYCFLQEINSPKKGPKRHRAILHSFLQEFWAPKSILFCGHASFACKLHLQFLVMLGSRRFANSRATSQAIDYSRKTLTVRHNFLISLRHCLSGTYYCIATDFLL